MFKRFDHFSRALVSSDGIALDYRSLSPQQTGHLAFSPAEDDFCSSCAGNGKFILGDARGGITIMGSLSLRPRRFQLLPAEDAAIHLAIAGAHLLCVSAQNLLLVFKMDEAVAGDEQLGLAPKLLGQHRITHARTAPTCIAFNSSDNSPANLFIALGYSDGRVTWLRAQNASGAMDFTMVGSIVDFAQPITALAFASTTTSLFVAGESRLVNYDAESSATILDREFGCALECGTWHSAKQLLVTCREDRIQYFSTENPGSCYSMPGNKLLLRALGDCLCLVSVQQQQGNAAESRLLCQVLDLGCKFIAHEFALLKGDSVRFLCADESTHCLFLLTKMKKLWRLRENELETRLNDLLKRNLFALAIQLAKRASSKCDLNYIADLHRRYAEHLYEKKNYEDAVQQFCHTIGRIEPSQVIRRFLDSNRVANLIVYLEALLLLEHDPRFTTTTPSRDLATLLLTCYAKTGQEDKMMSFIQTQAKQKASGGAGFDLAAALTMLKETGRIRQALLLAREHNETEWYLTTLLAWKGEGEDDARSNALEALEYITTPKLFFQHAFALTRLAPSECLEFAKRFDASSGSGEVAEAFLDAFLHDAWLTREYCMHLFENRAEAEEGTLSRRVWNTCLEVALARGEKEWSFAICSHAHSAFDVSQALFLLQRYGDLKSTYLLLERLGRFEDLLKLKLESPDWDGDDIIRLAASKFPSRASAHVWKQVLTFFVNKDSERREYFIRETLRHIEQGDTLPALVVLDIFSQSSTPAAEVNLGICRAYLVAQMERAARQSAEDAAEVAQLRADTERMQRERRALECEPRVFNATTCSLTGAALELPVVHFLSGNSYNLSSLPTNTATTTMSGKLQDPKCAQDQNSVLDIARGLAKRRADVDEEFFSELLQQQQQPQLRGEAGFSFVADYFGKCLFDEEEE